MTKSELIEKLINQKNNFSTKTIKKTVNGLLEYMANTLANGKRIEIRNFGSFSIHYRASHFARNPKSGNKVFIESKFIPHFKPSKTLRERIKREYQ
ncbi:Integration host factor subunit beta [Candidatus Providencia siddallii]|uniref:Integration host factor subunit beta n=1 Tax=Candidatus Providencia siddallii TaxID=1715285 RepID=A0A0M6W6W6_9GAMM|nr:Integration host factor subunit beta [Candidatus Providencia siddallii]